MSCQAGSGHWLVLVEVRNDKARVLETATKPVAAGCTLQLACQRQTSSVEPSGNGTRTHVMARGHVECH